ncbi:MAG: SigE family RNA polymerase sigma factor [Actinobacteria bacterium]|nr:SigE family RNA polymerase sigma factor [Actinomycetota bacterium]
MNRSTRSITRSTRDAEFVALVTTTRRDLVRLATMLAAGDGHLAEDVVQTALARMYVAWPKVRAARDPAAYGRRSVVNAFLDETRRPWRRERFTAEPPDLPSAVDALGEVERRVDGSAVRTALGRLPPGMRAVVVLRHWLDLSVEDTATHLGCSTGNVKSQNARGLAALRADLGPVWLDGLPGGSPRSLTHATADRTAGRPAGPLTPLEETL